jgi:hypothetical protein
MALNFATDSYRIPTPEEICTNEIYVHKWDNKWYNYYFIVPANLTLWWNEASERNQALEVLPRIFC